MKEGKSEFGVWLRGARKSRGLTMEALADAADITQPYVSGLERGIRRPSRDMVETLVKALTHGADTHLYHKWLNAAIKAAFPRPEDADETLSPAAALLRSTRAAQQATENGGGLTEAQMDALIDDLENFAEFSVTREAQKQVER